MTKSEILRKTRGYVKKTLQKEVTGHDWYHIERVVKCAKQIGKLEQADLFVVELAALLHDIADWKFTGDPDSGAKVSRRWLKKLNLDNSLIEKVVYIVQNISFKSGTNKHKMETIEGKVVQDADRLDALGAIGIARAFAYGGYKNRMIYEPNDKNEETSIKHFYDKILWISDLMNTQAGHRLAVKREKFVKDFLKQFYQEWEG